MSTASPSTLKLRLRLFALVGLLVAFDVAFVAATYVLAHVAAGLVPLLAYEYEHLFWSLGFDVVPLWPVLLVGTPLVLVVQSVFGYRLTLHDAAGVGRKLPVETDVEQADNRDNDATDYHHVAQRVARLSQLADVPTPDVRVIDDETPNSYVATRPGKRILFVTTGLVASLNSESLDAVLAHELAHLKNGDAFVMTAGAFLPTVTAWFNETLVALLRRSFLGQLFVDDSTDDDSSGFGGQMDFILILFAAFALPLSGLLYLTSTACYRLLSRIREYAADAGGVAICGSPAALADALETLTTDPRPEQDLRAASTGVRELCILPYEVDQEGSDQSQKRPDEILSRGRFRWQQVCQRVLPDSHPDVDDRIATLREQQATIESRESN